MAVELKNRVEEETGVVLPVVFPLQCGSGEVFVERLAAGLADHTRSTGCRFGRRLG